MAFIVFSFTSASFSQHLLVASGIRKPLTLCILVGYFSSSDTCDIGADSFVLWLQ